MKITVEISDHQPREVRTLATSQDTTLRTLIGHGLHRVAADARPGASFKLRRASYKGTGLQRESRDVDWDKLRAAAYGCGSA